MTVPTTPSMGIFTERDVLTRVVTAGLKVDDTPVAAVMTSSC